MGRVLFAILATALLFIPTAALAGSFRAVPVKLYLDSRTKTTVLKVTNDGEEKITVQLEAVEWSQDETGKDLFQPTKEIIFFPKIASIEKGEEKIIRVGYDGKTAGSVEKTFRLYIQELPVARPGEVAIKMAIRMGLPVFISPAKEARKSSIVETRLSEGSLKVKVQNDGNSHIVLNRIKARGYGEGKDAFLKESSGWYVLAGKARTFEVDIPKEDCLRADEIRVEADAGNNNHLEAAHAVDRSLCADKPAPQEHRKENPGKEKPGASD